ncbi:phosphomevalonate kinase-like [Limulus polyphemus]|uniref:Phosphomevalonate kinase n=1 Tax=Limulus polyphemus TaxID=6850 RepID=A0ABM1B5V6_LIMPO|nr:phosphomevalonate kinase-like [Limulus polyphemus]XP_022242695.1 phosphomevalonate kinase-like [Limulus polyphemus]XP_022242696.1 phosphomevalonate kinase-like [Limulus polyphemus]
MDDCYIPAYNPVLILVLSGKRKSGKDFVAELLKERMGIQKSVIIRLSGPLKEQYAKEHQLDYSRLLDATEYKEFYRTDMILWGEEIRRKNPGYFCYHALLQQNADKKPVWIVSDARRKTDITFFRTNYPCATKTVRVSATLETRKSRGWVFTPGVDDVESECGLDDVQDWDFVIKNDGDDILLNDGIQPILDLGVKRISLDNV